MAMTLVSTVTVGSGGAAAIEFTNIPQTGKDLLVLVSGRDVFGSQQIRTGLTLNNLTTSVYSTLYLYGNGSSAASESTSAATNMRFYTTAGQSSGTTANTFDNIAITIANYTSSANKSVSYDYVSENNATSAGQLIGAGLGAITSAISSVQILTGMGSSFVQFSSASLYIIS